MISYLGYYQEAYIEACWVAELSTYMCVYVANYIPYTIGMITEMIVTPAGIISPARSMHNTGTQISKFGGGGRNKGSNPATPPP